MRRAQTLVAAMFVAACARPAPVSPSATTPAASAPVPSTTAPARAPAAATTSGYEKPPQNILDVLHAPPPPTARVSPTGDAILLVSMVEYPPIERVAEPYLKLAGVRVEPKTRRQHDTPGGYGIAPCAREITIVKPGAAAEIHVDLPAGGCAEFPRWSPDGKRFAFASASSDAVELWIGDASTGAVRVVPGARLNPMLGSTFQWVGDRPTLLVKTIPESAGPPPPASTTPSGPSILETHGEKGQSSSYEARDALRDEHDEQLFEYFGTSQLAMVDVVSGKLTRVGKPGLYSGVEVAPDGEHVLVTTVKRPYSHLTTYGRFPHDVEVWDSTGKATPIASLPLADRVPVHGVPTGPRSHSWRQNAPATLMWAEALDGGDWNAKVPARDKVMMLAAPFSGAATEVLRTEQRYNGFGWGERPSLAIVYEHDENRHWRRSFVLDVDDRKAKPRLLWDLSTDERYKNPGTTVMRQLPNGAWVLHQDGDAVFLEGLGASSEGDRPFVDRLDLKTFGSQRLFRSEKTGYESFLAFGASGTRAFYTWHQSPVDPPNVFLRTLGDPMAHAPAGEPQVASSTRAITHFTDPTPAVRAIKKRLVKYKRKDGTDLSFTLYTPPGYVEGTRVPAILYAYPLDFVDPSKAAQVTGSEQLFTRLRNYRLLLLAGYAIIDNASFPIVGDPKKAYDTYLEQLVDDAKAAVDKAVELGVVDRDRIGVTGHSHGAMMTANLLAHTDLFRAGAATSGAYNKTLVPFGFQNERRSVWQAQDVYLKVSPFFFADKLKQPLLIVHGEDDANPGTPAQESTRLYEAIRGNGGTARLVMLPHEPHWYAAMESNEQLVAELVRWFDKYVKNAPPR